MPASKASASRFKRISTRNRGISYRLGVDGSKHYSVYHKGNYVAVAGGEGEALAKQAELRGASYRGEVAVLPTKATFAELAEAWLETKRVRPYTRRCYRQALDTVLIPRFGTMRLASITADHVAALIRDLEREGLHAIDPKVKRRPLSRSTVVNYCLPLSGAFDLAVRRGMVSSNPFKLLTRDERPTGKRGRRSRDWTIEEVKELLSASERLAKQPESRYDYSGVIRLAVFTGMRLGELLGLQWGDVDLQARSLIVSRQWTREGEYGPIKTEEGQGRSVPLDEGTVSYLAKLKLRSEYSADVDPVFASRNGKPLTHRNVTRRGFEASAKLAGLEDVSFHSLRHFFVSKQADSLNTLQEAVALAKVVGHTDVAFMLKNYGDTINSGEAHERIRKAMVEL